MGQSYAYDGFGNMTGQTVTAGSASSFLLSINPANNRINTFSYDANGNQTTAPLDAGTMTLTYDVENRLASSSAGEQYGYDPSNKRVWRQKAGGVEEVYFYSLSGERLGTYQPSVNGTAVRFLESHRNVHFVGRGRSG